MQLQSVEIYSPIILKREIKQNNKTPMLVGILCAIVLRVFFTLNKRENGGKESVSKCF